MLPLGRDRRQGDVEYETQQRRKNMEGRPKVDEEPDVDRVRFIGEHGPRPGHVVPEEVDDGIDP